MLDNWVSLMGSLGISWQAASWNIILPVGISFYTFQTMAYSLDVYLRRAEPADSMLDFSLFVTFFPQLVAGPDRAAHGHLLGQLRRPQGFD